MTDEILPLTQSEIVRFQEWLSEWSKWDDLDLHPRNRIDSRALGQAYIHKEPKPSGEVAQ